MLSRTNHFMILWLGRGRGSAMWVLTLDCMSSVYISSFDLWFTKYCQCFHLKLGSSCSMWMAESWTHQRLLFKRRWVYSILRPTSCLFSKPLLISQLTLLLVLIGKQLMKRVGHIPARFPAPILDSCNYFVRHFFVNEKKKNGRLMESFSSSALNGH